jgi:hypothetical protein
MMAGKTVQLNVRVSQTMYRKVQRSAKKSGWDCSKQVRATLERVYGADDEPYFPDLPSSDDPSRKDA